MVVPTLHFAPFLLAFHIASRVFSLKNKSVTFLLIQLVHVSNCPTDKYKALFLASVPLKLHILPCTIVIYVALVQVEAPVPLHMCLLPRALLPVLCLPIS